MEPKKIETALKFLAEQPTREAFFSAWKKTLTNLELPHHEFVDTFTKLLVQNKLPSVTMSELEKLDEYLDSKALDQAIRSMNLGKPRYAAIKDSVDNFGIPQ